MTSIPFLFSPFMASPLVFMIIYVWGHEFPNENIDVHGLFQVKVCHPFPFLYSKVSLKQGFYCPLYHCYARFGNLWHHHITLCGVFCHFSFVVDSFLPVYFSFFLVEWGACWTHKFLFKFSPSLFYFSVLYLSVIQVKLPLWSFGNIGKQTIYETSFSIPWII